MNNVNLGDIKFQKNFYYKTTQRATMCYWWMRNHRDKYPFGITSKEEKLIWDTIFSANLLHFDWTKRGCYVVDACGSFFFVNNKGHVKKTRVPPKTLEERIKNNVTSYDLYELFLD